ncbi:hypothetical protein BH10PLA2_BH10PLA2_35390 [soil metagenome]
MKLAKAWFRQILHRLGGIVDSASRTPYPAIILFEKSKGSCVQYRITAVPFNQLLLLGSDRTLVCWFLHNGWIPDDPMDSEFVNLFVRSLTR